MTDTRVVSNEARQSAAAGLANVRDRVYEWILDQGDYGATCDEAEQALNLSHQTCSARFHELRRDDRITETGTKRRTRSGRGAMAYRVPRRAEQLGLF